MIIRVTIPIKPKAQKRDRIGTRGGRAFSYKDSKQRLEEDKLITLLMAHKPPVLLLGPVSLTISVYLPIPKSKSRKWREQAENKEIRPISRPDVDNYAKMILDVMNEFYFKDDAQVTDLSIGKWYGAEPRWEIICKADY